MLLRENIHLSVFKWTHSPFEAEENTARILGLKAHHECFCSPRNEAEMEQLGWRRKPQKIQETAHKKPLQAYFL